VGEGDALEPRDTQSGKDGEMAECASLFCPTLAEVPSWVDQLRSALKIGQAVRRFLLSKRAVGTRDSALEILSFPECGGRTLTRGILPVR
jgi:hypothetical protein